MSEGLGSAVELTPLGMPVSERRQTTEGLWIYWQPVKTIVARTILHEDAQDGMRTDMKTSVNASRQGALCTLTCNADVWGPELQSRPTISPPPRPSSSHWTRVAPEMCSSTRRLGIKEMPSRCYVKTGRNAITPEHERGLCWAPMLLCSDPARGIPRGRCSPNIKPAVQQHSISPPSSSPPSPLPAWYTPCGYPCTGWTPRHWRGIRCLGR